MRRWAPSITVVALIASFVLVGWLWRESRRWFVRLALIIILLPLIVVAWFARQNHFEWMFNPLVHALPTWQSLNETPIKRLRLAASVLLFTCGLAKLIACESARAVFAQLLS